MDFDFDLDTNVLFWTGVFWLVTLAVIWKMSMEGLSTGMKITYSAITPFMYYYVVLFMTRR